MREQPMTNDERASGDVSPSYANSGSAEMQPNNDFSSTSSGLHEFVVNNLHLIIFATVAAYFIGRYIYSWYLDRRSKQLTGTSSLSDDQIQDKMRAAREKQFLASREANKRDIAVREARRLEDLAEKERKFKEMQAKAQAEGGAGHANNNDRLPFETQLPALPSGNNYRPSSQWDSNTGGGYRPTGFSRPTRRG